MTGAAGSGVRSVTPKEALGSWRTIRVFISSTFRDMHAERDHLVKVVFPALRERLLPYRVHLVDIDLRWGVTQEQSDNDRATELCLQQVDECRPFFLCILGERYGYAPNRVLESTISKYPWVRERLGRSVTELEIVAGIWGESEANASALFFFRDPAFVNQVPAAKRAEVQAESADAQQKVAELKAIVRRAALAMPPMESFPCSYRGLRVNPRLFTAALPREVREALMPIAQDGVVDSAEYGALDEPVRQIVDRQGIVYTGALEAFGRCVQERLWNAIRLELRLPDAPPAEPPRADPLGEEAQYHERFMESRLRVYVERARIQRRLLKHAMDTRPCTVLVTGPAGSGKSALMARLVQTLESFVGPAAPPEGSALCLVIPHFVGASPGSTNLRQMLRRFCLILRTRGRTGGETYPAQPPADGSPPKLPEQTDQLIEEFQRIVQSILPEDRVVVVIDALNQLDTTDNAHAMHWLPRNLPANFKLIVSCIDDSLGAQSVLGSYTSAPAPGAPQVLAAFRHRPHHRVEVMPLSNSERLEIVRAVPSVSAKTLDSRQIALLLENPATRNPLFLLVALEELRGFGSFEQLAARIAAFPRQGDTLTAIFLQVMERLEEEFGQDLVQRSHSYLGCSRYGLSEQELVELIAGTDRADPGSGDRATALYAVLRQIRPYTQYRGELLDFFHRNFQQAARQRYLQTPENRRESNAVLAAYFRRRADPQGTGDWSGNYPRGLNELTHHLADAGDSEALRGVVSDLRFLQGKLLAFDAQALIEDFGLALSLTPESSEEAKTLRLLRDALRLSVNQLACDPTQLLTQSWGRLMYDESAGVRIALQSFATKATKPWLRLWTQSLNLPGPLIWQGSAPRENWIHADTKVCLTADATRIVVAARDGSLSIFCPDTALPLMVLDGEADSGAVLDAVVTDGGEKVTVLRGDGSVDIWNLADEALEQMHPRVDLSCMRGEACAFASDGDLVMMGTAEGSIELRRIGDPNFQRSLEGHHLGLRAVDFNPVAGRAAAAYADGRVMVWDLESGQVIAPGPAFGEEMLRVGEERWQGYGAFGESPANALAVTDDGNRVFIGNAEKIFSNTESSFCAIEDIRGLLSQIDLTNGKQISGLETYSDSPVVDLDITPNERFGVTLSEGGVLKLWDLSRANERNALRQHYESSPIVAVTPDGRRVLSTADDGFLLIWELATGHVHRLRGYRDPAFDIRVSTDSRFAIMVSAGHCQVWDLERLVLGPILGPLPQNNGCGGFPKVWIRSVVPLPPGDRALIVAGDGTVTTWNLATGKCEDEPDRLPKPVLDAAASASGRWLLYLSADEAERRLVLHDRARKNPDRVHHLDSPVSEVAPLFPAPDGGQFRIAFKDGTIRVWDPECDSPEPLNEHAVRFTPRAITPDASYAVGYDGVGTVTLFDLQANVRLASFTAESAFASFALSSDGRLVAIGDDAGRVHILWLTLPENAPIGG